jgi:hypothetical protein
MFFLAALAVSPIVMTVATDVLLGGTLSCQGPAAASCTSACSPLAAATDTDAGSYTQCTGDFLFPTGGRTFTFALPASPSIVREVEFLLDNGSDDPLAFEVSALTATGQTAWAVSVCGKGETSSQEQKLFRVIAGPGSDVAVARVQFRFFFSMYFPDLLRWSYVRAHDALTGQAATSDRQRNGLYEAVCAAPVQDFSHTPQCAQLPNLAPAVAAARKCTTTSGPDGPGWAACARYSSGRTLGAAGKSLDDGSLASPYSAHALVAGCQALSRTAGWASGGSPVTGWRLWTLGTRSLCVRYTDQAAAPLPTDDWPFMICGDEHDAIFENFFTRWVIDLAAATTVTWYTVGLLSTTMGNDGHVAEVWPVYDASGTTEPADVPGANIFGFSNTVVHIDAPVVNAHSPFSGDLARNTLVNYKCRNKEGALWAVTDGVFGGVANFECTNRYAVDFVLRPFAVLCSLLTLVAAAPPTLTCLFQWEQCRRS